MDPQDRDDLDTDNSKEIKEAFKKYRDGEITKDELIDTVREKESEDVLEASNKSWFRKLFG